MMLWKSSFEGNQSFYFLIGEIYIHEVLGVRKIFDSPSNHTVGIIFNWVVAAGQLSTSKLYLKRLSAPLWVKSRLLGKAYC